MKETAQNHNLSNKGTAFTAKERKKLGLLGKLPYRIETLQEQTNRAFKKFKFHKDAKQKRLFLNELFHINQTLFYKLALDNLEEIVPLIYTPHVAHSCSYFSDEFDKPYGAYIAYKDQKQITKIIDNIAHKKIKVIVVTDGERILGIGDQGIGGIKISIGKLMLYSLFGGIDPETTLPIVLDVGTNNQELLNNPMYLGWRHKRITGKKYMAFVDKFVIALKKKLPHVLLQWEDFGKNNAWNILERHRKKICSFNDDIQGTATVTLATLLAAIKVSKEKITDQRIIILGAGSAAIGISNILVSYLKYKGLKNPNFHKNIWLVNRSGLITNLSKNISDVQKPYLHKINELKNWKIKNPENISLQEIVKNVKPTILLGCSTVGGAFTKEIVKEMSKHVKRPIILPLSNPTENSEATPENLIKWTDGRSLIATGSPFNPVTYKNKKITISQCNNALVFPGIGLGVIASKLKNISDDVFCAAAEVLYKKSPSLKKSNAPLLPSLKDIPNISKLIAKKILTISNKKNLNKINKLYWKPE